MTGGCCAPDSLGRHLVPAVGACPCGLVRRLLPAPPRRPRSYVIDVDGRRILDRR